MKSTYLRLGAPLQSWAEGRVTGNIVSTKRAPTRSGIIGLVAASLGAPRDEWPEWLDGLQITVRTDQAGWLVDDFQTINPRDEDLEYQQRLHVALTGRAWRRTAHFTPDARNLTSVLRRTYIANGEFLVEMHHETHGEELAAALKNPRFITYLGKKAFAPTFPYYLGEGPRGMLENLPTIEREKNRTLTIRDEHGKHAVSVPILPFDEWLETVGGKLERTG